MGFWLFLLGIGLVVYLLVKADSPGKSANDVAHAAELEARNAEWAQFIAGYHAVAKTKTEKKLIEQMLSDIAKQGLPVPLVGEMEAGASQPQLSANSQMIAAERTASVAQTSGAYLETPVFAASPERSAAQIQMDNASMLLYFGAFLFVASVGLFVAFGGLPGTLRTFAVAMVAVVMYGGGIWLFKNRTKLEQAGLAFAGIGLATAPFVGLAAYNFVFDQASGPLVWFVTSLFCMGLYLHALFVLRKPLLNYVLIFTFLSLIESGVSIISAPLYYFGWGMAAVGILLAVVSRLKGFDQEFRDSSSISAKAFMPLASAASVLMVASQGTGQLGVSLVLAAAFYALEFWNGSESEKTEDAIASQLASIGAVGALAYAAVPDFVVVAGCLLLFNGLQIVWMLVRGRKTELWLNFASLALVSSIAAVFLGAAEPNMLVVCLLALIINSLSVWRHLGRVEAYGLAVVAWMALPVVIGQVYLDPVLAIGQQVTVLLAALFVQWAVLLGLHNRESAEWYEWSRILYVLSGAGVAVAALMASPLVCLLACVAIAMSFALLAEHNHAQEWASLAGITLLVPIVRATDDHRIFLITVVIALLANIAIALRYRQELTRWLSAGLWLLLPIALDGNFGNWSISGFAWAYLGITLLLVLSRAIARGAVLVSGKVPLASYTKSASLSYVVGYSFAGIVALLASLSGENSQLHTSLILTVIAGLVLFLSVRVEKRPDLLVLLPLIAQGLLLSALRPVIHEASFDIYLIVSTAIALVSYVALIGQGTSKVQREMAAAARAGSLMAALITPAAWVFAGETRLMMPIGLLVFAGMLYHRMRETNQANREWIAGLGLMGIWWLMWFAGVRNLQAYTHVLAALFAAFAYWRHIRSDRATSDQYLFAMLGTATVPLAMQALGGRAGDMYGWWLLLEQVFFMLLGMSIKKPLVTRWGLYVATGAVLYQLRNLGWAALTVLALFLIGLAVYRLQNQDTEKKN